MTTRCAFFPKASGDFFDERLVEFRYENGLSAEQRYKSAANLRNAAIELFPGQKGLEVSRYSDNPIGVALSAFNLKVNLPVIGMIPIENLFQSSKVFENGGPFLDLLQVLPLAAKQDSRLKSSGDLREFRFAGDTWPLSSDTDFYDFFYIRALCQNPKLLDGLLEFGYFTDIACNKTALGFQKGKTFSTQARSCAIAVAMVRKNVIFQAVASQESYLAVLGRTPQFADGMSSGQPTLF